MLICLNFLFTQKMSLILTNSDSILQSNEQGLLLYQTGREGVPGALRAVTGGAGGATRIR